MSDPYSFPQAMMRLIAESPLVRAIIDQSVRAGSLGGLIEVLEERFGAVPPTIIAHLGNVQKIDDLLALATHAAVCDSVQSFESAILDASLRPTPSKRRSKRRSS
jgi:hypothetical protein